MLRTLAIAALAIGLLVGSVALTWAHSIAQDLSAHNSACIEVLFGD